MDLFNVVVFVSLFPLSCCLLNFKSEPMIEGDEHYNLFYYARVKIAHIEKRMSDATTIHDDVRTSACGTMKVPTGTFIIGFDPDYNDRKNARKTFVSAVIRPQHLNTGQTALSHAHARIVHQSLRLSDDQVGHVIGRALGGAGDECNLFPQSGQANNGGWRRKETLVKQFLEAGISKDRAGRIHVDPRYVEVKIAFEYKNDDKKDPDGEPYPKERPSAFFYQFVMKKDANDNNPDILAGFYLNQSYLKRFKYNLGAGSTSEYFKDEPDYYTAPLSYQKLDGYEQAHPDPHWDSMPL